MDQFVLVGVSIASASLVVTIAVDFLRRGFPNLTQRQLKFATVAVSILVSTLLLLSTMIPTVETYVGYFFSILLGASGFYALVWKDSTIHTKIINP